MLPVLLYLGLCCCCGEAPIALPSSPCCAAAQAYLLYHPDLRSLGVTGEDAARKHYLERGRAEGRVYKRIRVVRRYTACTGLINQHYSHIAAFSLAAMLGAELVLPPAVCRDSFAHYFSVFKEKNEVQWSPVPLESLLDVDGIINYWRPRGLVLHKVRVRALGRLAGYTGSEWAAMQVPVWWCHGWLGWAKGCPSARCARKQMVGRSVQHFESVCQRRVVAGKLEVLYVPGVKNAAYVGFWIGKATWASMHCRHQH